MLNVMLLSAGVTTGWHLAQVAQQQFSGDICLHLCDTNPRELVPAAALGGPFHRVLPLADPGYQQQILTLLKENHIDVIVPLIDQDLFTWAADAPELAALGVRSTAPLRQTAQLLTDKKAMAAFLQAHGLPTPPLVAPEQMEPGRHRKARGRLRFRRAAHGHRRRGLHPAPRQHFTGKMRRRRHRNHRRSFQRPGQAAGVLP